MDFRSVNSLLGELESSRLEALHARMATQWTAVSRVLRPAGDVEIGVENRCLGKQHGPD